MNSSCSRTTKKSFFAYSGMVVRVCTVNFTLSFSLSASDMSTTSEFSPSGLDGDALLCWPLSSSCESLGDDCSGWSSIWPDAPPASDAVLDALSPLSPTVSCNGLPFALSYRVNDKTKRVFIHLTFADFSWPRAVLFLSGIYDTSRKHPFCVALCFFAHISGEEITHRHHIFFACLHSNECSLLCSDFDANIFINSPEKLRKRHQIATIITHHFISVNNCAAKYACQYSAIPTELSITPAADLWLQ